MALTISETRYQQIKAEVERRRLVAKAAEIIAETELDQPAYASVDEFLAAADRSAESERSRSRKKAR